MIDFSLGIVAAATVIIIGLLSMLIGRLKPKQLNENRSTIQPERISAWLTILFGSLMLFGGLGLVVTENAGGAGIGLAVMGAACTGFMAPSVTSIHAVHWDKTLIEGPSKTFGPTLGLARTQIHWNEIARTGKTITGYWFVESNDGRRIYWSYLYKGYGFLITAIRRNCPSLELHTDFS